MYELNSVGASTKPYGRPIFLGVPGTDIIIHFHAEAAVSQQQFDRTNTPEGRHCKASDVR